jgi:hypothetical protein
VLRRHTKGPAPTRLDRLLLLLLAMPAAGVERTGGGGQIGGLGVLGYS